MSIKGLRTPIYDATKDGNVFRWLIEAAKDYRNIRQRERFIALEKLQFLQREKGKYGYKRDQFI